jgi:hypothetical protein
MDNQEKEALIKEKYGYTILESGPVDPDNPTFDSLLGVMKDVYYGNCEIDILIKYHKGLSKQLENSREFLKKMSGRTKKEYEEMVKDLDNPSPVELKELYIANEKVKDQYNISLGSIDIVQGTLDLLDSYIKNPSKELMATCVESLLHSQRIMKGVHDMLDENINQSGTEEE